MSIWNWLGPPRSCDEEQMRVGRAVRVLVLSFVAGVIPPLFVHWQRGWIEGFWTLFTSELALLTVLLLNRRGHTHGSARMLTLIVLAGSAALVYYSGDGYRDLSVLILPAILVTGALLLPRRSYIGLSFLVVMVASTLVLLQIHGLNPNALRAQGDYSDLMTIAIILTVISFAVGLLAAELRRSLLNYRTLIQQLGEGLVVLDEDQRIRLANPEAAKIFGLPEEALKGRSIRDFVSSDDWPANASRADTGGAGQGVTAEVNGQSADGTRRRLLATCTSRLGEVAQRLGSIIVLRDITAARQADERMRLLAHALRSTDDCVCITDVSDRIVYANDALLRTYGYTESELLGQEVRILRARRTAAGLEGEILPAVLEDGWRGELWNRSKDGREFPVSLTVSVVRDERGLVIATVGVARDLTQRRAIEGALKESERRFQALLQHVNVAAVILDVEGRITFCNDVVLAALGRQRESVIGRPAIDFLAPEFRRQHLKNLRDAIRLRQPLQGSETALMAADGSRRWFQWSNTELLQADATLAGWACLGFDMTEQRALQEQYLQAQKLESIGRLAGGVAHDFNNLLMVINGFGELLLQELDTSSPLRSQIEMVLRAGEQAAALTQQLLVFSRKQASQPKPVDLNQVVAEVGKLLTRILGEDIDVSTHLSPSLGLVMVDPSQMHQVLMNLAVNARDAMPKGGRLSLETGNLELGPEAINQHPGVPPGSYVHVMVTDTGMGMPEEVLGQIFEPFFTTKESGKGTGLGLAIVYGIVRQSGGWIRVWSEPGRGAAFHLYLPRIQTPSAHQYVTAKPTAQASGSETILLVEDQAPVRQLIKTILAGCGYRVLTASDGLGAFSLAEGHAEPIHLLLTDLVMPGMDGRVLAERLKAVRPGMRVLYMTGYAAELPGSRLSVPETNCLPKPIKLQTLTAKVREVLSAAEST